MMAECMTDKHRSILRKSRVFLIRDLDIGILDHLVSKLILTDEDEERINAEPVRHDKVKRLLEILPRRGDEVYDSFLEVLATQQDYLFDQVKEVERHEADSPSDSSSYSSLSSGFSEEVQHPRGDSSLFRENQTTRGIVTQPTDDQSAKSMEDVKPTLEDFKEDEPMDDASFGLPPVCLQITGPDEGQRIDPTRTRPRNPNKVVDQKALSKLASNLGAEWEALAIHMNFPTNKIYHFKENSKYNVWGQVFAFLAAWKNMKGNKATVETLIGELRSFQQPGVNQGAYRHLFFE